MNTKTFSIIGFFVVIFFLTKQIIDMLSGESNFGDSTLFFVPLLFFGIALVSLFFFFQAAFSKNERKTENIPPSTVSKSTILKRESNFLTNFRSIGIWPFILYYGLLLGSFVFERILGDDLTLFATFVSLTPLLVMGVLGFVLVRIKSFPVSNSINIIAIFSSLVGVGSIVLFVIMNPSEYFSNSTPWVVTVSSLVFGWTGIFIGGTIFGTIGSLIGRVGSIVNNRVKNISK
ncbi:MAG: hypothetical protein EOM19_07920 [Candidatus Moranbacteria bacterium]|nr:hypothetical protein [Candidatus Moranbacteria bacterium]